MFRKDKSRQYRNQKGVLAPLLFGALIIAGFAICALGVDTAYLVHVQNELQSAADAGALAGAQGLSTDAFVAEQRAYAACGMNSANGEVVSNETAGTEVIVEVDPAAAEFLGEVTVVASMEVEHLLAKIIGRNASIIFATATAAAEGTTKTMGRDQAFPLAISLDGDTGVPGAQPVSQYGLGDTVTITLWDQQTANSAFTTFGSDAIAASFDLMQSAHASENGISYINRAIDQALGITSVETNFRPAVKVGDSLDLHNGQAAAVHMARGGRPGVMIGQTHVFPVITGQAPYGDARQVRGFIALRITSLNISQNRVQSITGELVRTAVKGRVGIVGDTGSDAMNELLRDISTRGVRLIQRTS